MDGGRQTKNRGNLDKQIINASILGLAFDLSAKANHIFIDTLTRYIKLSHHAGTKSIYAPSCKIKNSCLVSFGVRE